MHLCFIHFLFIFLFYELLSLRISLAQIFNLHPHVLVFFQPLETLIHMGWSFSNHQKPSFTYIGPFYNY